MFTFEESENINQSINELNLRPIIDFLKSHVEYFHAFGQIIRDYSMPFNSKDERESLKQIIKLTIEAEVDINESLEANKSKFEDLILDMYDTTDPSINNKRGKILEVLIYTFGPINNMSNNAIDMYVEPRINHDNTIVGTSNHKMDVVFYDYSFLELTECKVKVQLLIEYKYDINKWNSKKAEKVRYMNRLHQYVEGTSVDHEIFLATLNSSKKLKRYNKIMTKNNIGFIKMLSIDDLAKMLFAE